MDKIGIFSSEGMPFLAEVQRHKSHLDSKNFFFFCKNMHTNIHSSIVHNGQEMEATQVSFDEWMDKYNVVHPYYGMSLS